MLVLVVAFQNTQRNKETNKKQQQPNLETLNMVLVLSKFILN